MIFGRKPRVDWIRPWLAVFAFSCCLPAGAQIEGLKNEAMKKIEDFETEALFKEVDLSKKYVAALGALEARFTNEGNLDAIVRIREEKESVSKTGQTTSHADAPLVELREKYVNAKKVIRDEVDALRRSVSEEVSKQLKDQESALVKAGKVEEALAFRKEGEALLGEIDAGVPAGDEEVFDDPREGILSPLRAVTVPDRKPPAADRPFSSNRWLEAMTVPAVKQRIGENLWIGDRQKGKWTLVVIPKGTTWVSNRGVRVITISAGNVVATKATFEDLTLLADLSCHYYFLNCSLDGCGFGKGGNWYGQDQAAKFYFENCVVTGRFSQAANIRDHGFRGQNSVFEKIDLPAVNYRNSEPIRYLNHPWMKFANCRFVNCKVPSSFALLTRDCIFENCTFVDDADLTEVKRPIEVTLYLDAGCRWNISKLPPTVTFVRKTDKDLTGVSVPNAASLRQMMGQ